ncbi:MAG: hypothetical protein ACOC02_05545, partial [Guyparkeria sp.]
IRSISWGIVFLLGAMLSLIDVMESLNAFDPVVGILASALPMQAPRAIVLALLLVAAAIIRGAFSSISAAYIVLFPILLEFAALGVQLVCLFFQEVHALLQIGERLAGGLPFFLGGGDLLALRIDALLQGRVGDHGGGCAREQGQEDEAGRTDESGSLPARRGIQVWMWLWQGCP